MRFIGHHYNETTADPMRCLVAISTGKWSHISQCQRKRVEGKLRCAQHEAKDSPVVPDDPIIARVTLLEPGGRFFKLATRGWFQAARGRVTDKILAVALDRIVELDGSS